MEKKIVEIQANGKFKNWAKVVTGVDTSKKDGYAFMGDFIKVNQLVELNVGDKVLVYTENGSHKYHYSHVKLLKVIDTKQDSESTFEVLHEYTSDYNKWDWALAVRDDIARIFKQELIVSEDQKNIENPLSKFSEDELLKELLTRNPEWIVVKNSRDNVLHDKKTE